MDPPIRLNAYVWETQPGRMSLTVACELAYKLVHGAEAQPIEPVRFYDEDLAAFADADVRAPFKPRADLLIVGHAYSPASDGDVDKLLVRVRIGEFSKAVRVTGDRQWVRDQGRLVPGAPRKFRRMLLSPDRAPRSMENPRGLDPETVPIEHRIAMPNLEPYARGQEAFVGPVPPTAQTRASALHPKAAAWVRALLAGQHAGPQPENVAFSYFNFAPVDQQLTDIAPGSAIVLESLHPEHALFSSRLPAVKPRAFVFDPITRGHMEVELRCDTMWIDADREIAQLVFRGLTPVSHRDAAGQVSVRVEAFSREEVAKGLFETRQGSLERGVGLPFAAATPKQTPALPKSGPNDTAPLAKLVLPGERPAPPRVTLPSQPAQQQNKMFVTQEISLGGPMAATPFEPKVEEETTQNFGKPRTATEPPAPNEDSSDDADAPTPAPYQQIELTSSSNPTVVNDLSSAETLGPVQLVKLVPPEIPPTVQPPLPPKPSPKGVAPVAIARTGGSTPPPPARVSPSVRPGDSSPPSIGLRPPPKIVATAAGPDSARLGALKLGMGKLKTSGLLVDEDGEPMTTVRTLKEALPPSSPPPPPSAPPPPPSVEPPAPLAAPPPRPALAPTITEEVVLSEATADALTREPTNDSRPRPLGEESTETSASIVRSIEARTLEEAEAEADRDAFEFPLPPSDGFEVDGVTLEHCAAVRAALAMPGADRAGVLAKNDLDDATWARIEKAHMARIDQETSKGVMDLLSRYDASYVAAQDKLRRPIGVKEYARIVVARESGNLAEAMSELAIPRSELMRLDRVWKLRRASYPEVDKAIESALATMRDGKR